MTDSTDLALRAFEARPTRAEALADLARHYRERGMNETAAMLARRGLAISLSDDLLFVETQAREEFRTTLSISGYYSKDPETRRLAAETVNALALDRSASPGAHDLARRNYHFYLRHIGELFPSWSARRLTFEPPDSYVQMAPSVTRLGQRLVAAQRTVNYAIDAGGYYQVDGHRHFTAGGIIHSRTLLVEFDPDTLIESVRGELTLGLEPVFGACRVRNFEDARLFEWRGDLWIVTTVLDQNSDGRAEQWLAAVSPSLQLTDAHPVRAEGLQQPREKNWMPVVDQDGQRLRFVYMCDPTTVLNESGLVLMREPSTFAADHLRGSSQLVPFDGGHLSVVHWVVWFDGWPKYRHRLAWFDGDLRLRRFSPGWVFPSNAEMEILRGYQFVTGLTWHPDERRLVMGFHVDEREAWIGTLDANDVREMLGVGG